MKTIRHADGGITVVPETDDEKRIHEAGVTACLDAIRMEMGIIEMHREIGSDPGDFRDVGLEEAWDAMEKEGNKDPDAINAVTTDERVMTALNELYKALEGS